MIGALAVLLAITCAASGETVQVARVAYLMGTRAMLVAHAESRSGAVAALERVLIALEAAENDLSTWRETPLNRLNLVPAETSITLTFDQCALFDRLNESSRDTDGAFDPAVGPLIDLWGVQTAARIPPARAVASALPSARLAAWSFDATTCTVRRPKGGRLDSGAFGKGEAIDRAARETAEGEGWLVDLGGQIGVAGTPPPQGWRIAIAHPQDRARAILELTLVEGSVSTSGGSERDRFVRGARVGHIIDPRTGRPARFDGSVVVWNASGFAADVLSTALYVMGVEPGLRWAEAHRIAACFLVPAHRRVIVRPSSAFAARFPNLPASVE